MSIGPGPGESVQLLELPRAEVSVGLFRALRSGGKGILVHSAVIHGLKVNVEKLKDGTTNLERLAKQFQQLSTRRSPAQPAPLATGPAGACAVAAAQPGGGPRRHRGCPLRLPRPDGPRGQGAVGRSLRRRGSRPAGGKPLELVVKAAVLASTQNLELRVKAAPLPPSLVPVPEQVTLKVQPIDLTPLAPFLPKSVGLRAAGFRPTSRRRWARRCRAGPVRPRCWEASATQLAFAGQQGGKRLDAALDANLTANLRAGNLDLEKLELAMALPRSPATARRPGSSGARRA